MTRILMIDDDVEDVEIIKELLHRNPMFSSRFEHCSTLDEGIARLHQPPTIDVVLLDLALGEVQGPEGFQKLQQAFPEIPAIILSGNLDLIMALSLLKQGAQDCLFKGHFDTTVLCSSIQFALERQNLRQELKDKNRMLEELSGQLATANQQLEQLTVQDSLTKIWNRRRFDAVLMMEWVRLLRSREPLSLILCDVDYFKAFNDTYGHQAGDRCLYTIAQAIADAVKRPADCVARYGGEEFVVVLPHTNQVGAIHVAETIRTTIEALKIPHSSSLVSQHVSLSLGVASLIPTKEMAPSQLVEEADQALYIAKQKGRNRLSYLALTSNSAQ